MAEAVVALGLACNVLQIVQSGRGAMKIIREISLVGSAAAIESASERSEEIEKAARYLRDWLDQLKATSRPLTQTEDELQRVAGQCISTAEALRKKLKPLKKDAKGRKLVVVTTALKTLLSKHDIESIDSQLCKYESILQTKILINLDANIAKQTLQLLEQDSVLEHLDQALIEFMQRLADGCIKTEDLIRNEAATTRLEIREDGQNTRDHVDRRLQVLKTEHLSETQHRFLLESLRYPEMNRRRNEIKVSHEKTFGWIYDQSRSYRWSSFTHFLHGVEAKDKMYWIKGKPGSGKSCLMKFIQNDRRTRECFAKWQTGRSIRILSHYFWIIGNGSERNIRGLLLSLVIQILQDAPDLVLTLAAGNRKIANYRNDNDWSDDDLKAVLKRTTESNTQSILILIDALDEVEQDAKLDLVNLVKELTLLENVKVCVSSRPESHFEISLLACPCLKLEDLTEEDMSVFVHDKLTSFSRSSFGPLKQSRLEQLVKKIVERAEGVFLYTSYMLTNLYNSILGIDSWDTLQKIIEESPAGMESLYNHTWNRLNKHQKHWRVDAAKYFRFILGGDEVGFSQSEFECGLLALMFAENGTLRDKVISEEEVLDLSALEKKCVETKHRVLIRCAGLVEMGSNIRPTGRWDTEAIDGEETYIKDENGSEILSSFQLIHRTARDFLLATPDGEEILKYCPEETQGMTLNIAIYQAIAVVIYPWLHFFHVRQLVRQLGSHHATGSRDEAVQMLRSFIQLIQNIGHKHGQKWSLDGWTLSLKGFAPFSFANDMLGYVMTVWPTLGLSFVESSIGRRELTPEYASYLLACIADHCRQESIDEAALDCLDCLYRRGADPNMRFPYVLGSMEHRQRLASWQALSFFPNHVALRFLENLISHGLDLKQTFLTVFNVSVLVPVVLFSPSSVCVVVEANLLEYLRYRGLVSNNHQKFFNHILQEEPDFRPIRRLLFIKDYSTNSEQDQYVKLSKKEDVQLLASAIDEFEATFSQKYDSSQVQKLPDREKARAASWLWEDIVGNVAQRVCERSEKIDRYEMISEFLEKGWFIPTSEVRPPKVFKDDPEN